MFLHNNDLLNFLCEALAYAVRLSSLLLDLASFTPSVNKLRSPKPLSLFGQSSLGVRFAASPIETANLRFICHMTSS